MEYKIQKFTIKYSTKLAKEQKENKALVDNKLKVLESNLNTEDSIQSCNIYKKELVESTKKNVIMKIKFVSLYLMKEK